MKRISTLFVFLIATFSIRTLTRTFRLKGALLASAMLLPWMVQAQTQATNIVFQPVPGSATSMSINWTNGTGTVGRIVVVKSLSANFTPVTANITSLNAALTYSNGASNDQDASAEVAAVVFAGTGNGPISVAGLTSGVSYVVQVYEFTGTTVAPNYILTSNTNNPVRLNFYTATGVFTVPSGVTSVSVQAWGSGAGGGEGASGNAGSGGGGGAYAGGTAAVTFGSNQTVTVGTGGSGGNNNTNGSAGSASSFGALIVAPGGSVNNVGAVAAGGTGGTGTTLVPGGNGGAGDAVASRGGGGGGSSGSTGTVANGSSAGGTATGGNGGDGTDGDGGKGGDNGTSNAQPGQFPGGGGGGRGDGGGSGGTGGGGLVIVSFPAPPSITSATLNYGTGVLVVTLSEGVSSLNNVDATKFHINNTTGVNLVNLSEAEETSFTGNTITFTLTEVNRLAAIAVSGTTGGDGGAVVLDVEAGGVTTTTANPTDNNNTVTETADTTKPTVVSATLNYGTGVLVVTLSEAVKDINGIDATKFHINDATGTDNVNLTNGERTSVSQANKTVTFTLTEANRLAALALSGVTGGNGGAVVLDVDAAGVTDAATNTNNIDDNNPVTETADTVPPSVASAAIDYNTGVLVVTLTEGVANTAAVDGTKFHINNISGTDLINLTNGEVTSVNTAARTVTFTLTEVQRIAAIAISGTTGGDAGAVKLDVDAGGLTDPRGNANATNIDNTTPTETADTTKPTVTSATLDYGTGILVVTLSEGLKDINGLNGALFHLNDATGTDNVTLSNAERTSVDQANKTATFTLTNSNRLAALAISGVAGGNGGAVVLDVDAAGVTDAATNTNNIDDNNAVTETADTTAPTILSASINYGTGVMVVTLSEGVANTAAVDATKFHINNITGTDLINLTVGELTSVNTGAATVTFTLTEVHRIAAIAISGTTGGDGGAAKLDADIGALTDPQANSNAAAIDNTTLTETADSVNPTVTSATLNYGTGVLVVTLSEGVKDINALDGTKFHLNDATGTDNVTLSNGERTSVDQATKTVTFTLSEANRGAALLLSGTTGGNGGAVVLDVDAGGVTDAANNANTIDDNNPVTESADAVAPTVTSATLDYGTGILVVTFSEGIPLASVDGTKFHINNTTGSDAVTLSAGEKTSANLGARTVTFTLTETNRLAALAISSVAGGDGGAVVLDVDASGIADVATNALAADDDNNTVTETADTVAPSVTSANINYGTGVLVVTLTEGVANTAAVTASEFHINNITGTDNITLTNGELTSVNTAARTITFTLTEANRVAALALSGTAGGDGGAVKLDVDAAAFTDPRGNANAADIDNTTPTETADSVVPVASAPTSVAQRLKTGATSTSTVASNESASIIYLVKNGVAAGTTGQITTAIGANNAFQVQANATKDQAYTVTVPASVNDGTYDIVVVDKAGNVSAITSGWLYIDNTAPTVAITRQTATPTNLTTLNFNVTFDEGVTGVDLADFLLQTGNINDATGTLSITPNSASSYTIQVSSVVGQNAGNFLSVLNLDFAGATGIVDLAGNAFSGTFTEEEYEVDNTPPALTPDQMLLKDNGVAVETITFNLSEELNVAEGASVITGFSTSSGSIASAIYTGKGTTNKVTLTSAANGQWTTATTVSYNGAGAYTDVIGNLLANITNHVVIQPVVNMVAGDIAFTTVRSDDTDQFSVVLLRSVPAGTQIYFTDRGWNSTGTPAIEDFSDDGLFIWTASAAYSAGTEIKFLSNGSNVFSSSLGSVANDAEKVAISASNGDEILAYQTDGSTITFLAAIKFGDGENWEADGNPDGGNESAVPAGLTASHYLLLGNRDDGAYRRTATASTFTGSTTELRALINNVANWDVDDDPMNVDLPGDLAPNDNTAWANFSPSSITYVIRPKINSVSIPNVAMKVGSVVTATINVDDDAALTPVSLTSGTIGGFTLGTFNRTNATTYTAQFTVAEGGTDVAAGNDVPVANLVLQNSLGNSNPAFGANVNPAGNADAIDAKSPKVASLVRQTATTTQFGTSAASVVFRMTFVSAGTAIPEDIQIATLSAADFSIPVTGSVTGAAVTGVAAVSTGVYDITVGNYSGTGTLGLNYRDSEVNVAGASVLDLAGNPTITAAGTPDGSFTGEVYSIVLPEPGAGGGPIPVTVSAFSSNSITVQWSGDATTPLPTHYLVLARLTSAGVPVVGTDVADFTYQNDDVMVQNVTRVAGTHSAQFTGLASGTSYSFYVFKYALSPNNTSNHIDFQYTNFGQVSQATSTAELSWIRTTAAPITISSIKNSSGNSAAVLQFEIFDDGLDPLASSGMALHANGILPETVTFTLRDRLTVGNGGSVTGFSSSTGAVASAIYTEQGATYTITLTNAINGTWNSTTKISYDAVAGNAVFNTLGKMQSIDSHPVIQDVVQFYNTDGTFVVPAGVTSITVEAWGAGGSGGEYSTAYGPGSSGGGGGGAYSRSTLTVNPGDNFNFTIGQGGAARPAAPCCAFGNNGGTTNFAGLVVAEGGFAGLPSAWHSVYGPADANPPYGYGGRAAVGTGAVKYDGSRGGFGQNISPSTGGSGGSAAGPAGSGNPGGVGSACALCTVTGGFSSGEAGSGGYGAEGFAGGTGGFPGGGGGGVGSGLNSGAGANGRIRISYTPAVAPDAPDWDADNSPFKFSQLVVTQGTSGNSPALANWQNIILGAELSDGTANPAVAGTINPNNITFGSIPTGAGDVGYVSDATTGPSSKAYSVKIWLRTDLSNTLAATVDGLSLAFKLDPADLVYDDGGSQSSRLVSPHPTYETGGNTIAVVADQLVYRTPGTTSPTDTNPQPQIGVGIAFSASTAQDPEVYALDANNNLDLDFDKTAVNINISNTGSFGQSITAPQFIDGKLALNGYRFTTGSTSVVNTQIVVATTGTPAVTPATSTDVAPFISSLTTIGTGPTAEAALIPSTTTSLTGATPQNFDFVLTDDVGANTTTFADNDALPTILTNVSITQHTDNGAVSGGGDPEFDLWLRSIAGAELSRTGSPTTVLATVTNTSLDFDLTTLTPAQITNFATITDGGTATFKLRVWLNGPVDASLRTIIDGLDLVFNVDTNGLLVASGSQSSFVATGQNLNSGNNNNQIEVDATSLIFAQDFSGALSFATVPPAANSGIDYLVNTSATTLGYSNPTVEAVDSYGLRDTDYSATVTTANGDALGMSNQLTSLTAGVGTFSGGFLYTAVGDGTLSVSTATGNRVGFVPTATTNGQPINVRTGNATTFDVASTVVSSPIASIVNAAPGFTVLKFRVDDDPAGTPVSENDGNPTLITTMTLTNTTANNTIVDWREAIAGARLEDAGNAAKFVDLAPATQIGANTLTFTSIPTASGELGFIADNNTKEYNLRIWLKSNLAGTQNYDRIIDGLEFGFNVLSTNVTTSVSGTSFTLALQQPNAANGASTVEVTATQIDIVNPVQPTVPPGPASASLEVPLQVQLEARDVNSNLDLDFNSTITSIANNSGATMQSPKGTNINTGGSDITFGVTAFSGGLYNLPYTTTPSLNGFQFTSGNDNDDVSLDISAGGINTLTSFGPKYPEIRLRSSFESSLVIDGPVVSMDIPYEANQDINTAATSFAIAQFRLIDGNGVTPDSDGAATNIDDLTLSVTAASTHNIRDLAVYVGSTRVQTKSNAAFSGGSVTFDDLFADLIAPDGGSLVFTIRASFYNTPAAITDNDPIKLAVTAVTQAGGSKFVPGPGMIGGVIGGAQGATHQIEVTATSLDFEDPSGTLTQPSAYAGKLEPIDGQPGASPGGNTGIVYARDKFSVLDVDFNSAATVNAGAVATGYQGSFTAGELDLTGMQYQTAGDGTLQVLAGGLDSNIPGVGNIGNSTPSATVDVVHVTAVRNDANGVQTEPSLRGGTTGVRIFGVEFSSEHSSTTEPKLNGFSVIFRDSDGDPYPYTSGSGTIFQNFKLAVSEGTGAPTVLTAGVDFTLNESQTAAMIASGAPSTSKDKLDFTLTSAVPLYQSNYSFYLSVDVNVNVTVGTKPITPLLIDNGYDNTSGSFTATNDNIRTSVGSSSAQVVGIERKFASTKPPVLVRTSPLNGKLNVDPDLNLIEMEFDVPVVTFDGIIKIYNRETGSLRAIFEATNGKYVDGVPLDQQVVDVLNFVPVDPAFNFKNDTVYYVTVEKGVFSNTDASQRKGISDVGFNLFGGIDYNGTFYFKGSSLVAPKLLATDATKYQFTPTSATFNFRFDQRGRVYYLVVHPTSPGAAPATVTKAQIRGDDPYTNSTIIKRGNIVVDQVTPNLQHVTINANLTNNVDYFVYAYAENDAEPTPIEATGPYGAFIGSNSSNNYAAGSPGPTFKIRKTSANTQLVSNPRMELCANSSVKMEEPIIISEPLSNNADFAATVASGATQTFNILLPTGFRFDVTKAPNVQFNGSDFGTLPIGVDPYRFRNDALLEINFVNRNNGISGSFDNILIGDLYIIASASDLSGDITRFGGNGLTTIAEDRILARISSAPASSITFTNSYDKANKFSTIYPRITKTVTYIPDNFGATVRLIPQLPTGDYGSSFFSGSGLTNDVLTLAAVNLDAAFNITLTHTDPNGCVSNTQEQYLVYDHESAIPELLEDPESPNFTISGTKVGLTPGQPNPKNNFPGVPPSTLIASDSVSFVGQAGYQLIDLYADIPVTAKGSGQVLDYNSPGWQSLVRNIPRIAVNDKNGNGGIHPNATLLGVVSGVPGAFKTYNWEYSDLINLNSTNNAGVINPYDSIKGQGPFVAVSDQGRTYYRAGSLGIIEFTGIYQSTADYGLIVPFRQEVELFVPAIPVVEVPDNPNRKSIGSTPIFCENDTPFKISADPKPTPGESTGYFTLRDSVTNNVITDPGFVDSGTGSAQFDPSSTILKNGYRTIKVEYTFQSNNSPAKGTGVLYIRIQPNPIAAFTAMSKVGPNTPNSSAYCEGIVVEFEGNSSTIASGSITDYAWDFDDDSQVGSVATDIKASHTFIQSAKYNPTLTVTSTFGCKSIPATLELKVGSIPKVDFIYEGVSTADDIGFTNKSTIASATTVGDGFGKLAWTYDYPSSTPVDVNSDFGVMIPHKYSAAGVYTVNLEVTSVLGCRNQNSHEIIVLPREEVTDTDAYEEKFETGDGEWQTNALRNSTTSWAHGAPAKAAITLTAENGSNIWVTKLNGFYDPSEKSALYSPSFNLSKLERPMISFDHFTHLAAGEGVAIEYSIDNKNVADPSKEWIVLGAVNPALGWYNANGLSSQPGLKNFEGLGWSSEDKQWSESKYVLDAVLGQPRVVFRFAMSTLTDSPTKDGFAVDNVRVGNRTRTVLVENFKNLGNNAGNPIIERAQSEKLKTFKEGAIGTKLVKVNYHVGFPQQDPFNLDNPQDPSSRALYYNVKATPVVRMDGEGEEGLFSSWGENKYDVQTLKLANARIDIDVSTNADGSLSADVEVISVSKTLPAQSTILQVAVVEKSVALNALPQSLRDLVRTGEDNFEFVVKKMLPTAAGTRFTQTLTDGQSQKFTGFTWTPDRTRLYSTDNLAVVAFIQDEVTREVYQAEIQDLGIDPPAVTGLEDGLRIEDVILHPNPADHEVTVRLPRNAVADVDIQMIDQAGRTLQTATLPKGERATTLNVRDLPSSVYLLKLTENGRVTYKRAMVVHRN